MRFIWSPVAVTSSRESSNVTKHYVSKTRKHNLICERFCMTHTDFFISSGGCLTSQTTSPMTQRSLCPYVFCCDWETLATGMTNSASKASLSPPHPAVAPHSPSLRPFLRQRTLGIWASSWQSSAGGGEQRRWDVMVKAEHTLRNTPVLLQTQPRLTLRHLPPCPPQKKHTTQEDASAWYDSKTHHVQTFIRVLRIIRNT